MNPRKEKGASNGLHALMEENYPIKCNPLSGKIVRIHGGSKLGSWMQATMLKPL